MPRVHTAIAAKDYPAAGIQRGEQYWYWTPYRARRQMSKTQPMPSQVESNPTRSSYMALQEAASLDIDQAATIEDIRDALENARSDAENIAEELREKASNIEDGFGHETEMSDQFNQQADEVESWADELTSLDWPQDAVSGTLVERISAVNTFRDDAQTALGEAPEI
jgi:ABC-type transporter Mla subunit MlaD